MEDKNQEKENYTDINKWDNYYINVEKNDTNPPWESQEVFHALKDFIEEPDKYLNLQNYKYCIDNSNMKIIELGSGASFTSIWLASIGHEVTAIDISPSAIKRAKIIDKNNSVNWICLDIFNNNFFKEIKEEFYDFLFDMQCFHVLRDINIDLFCKIVFKLLKKGGQLMVVVGACIDTYSKDKLMEKSQNAKGPPKLCVDDVLIPFTQIGMKVISIKLSRFNSTIAYGEEPPICWVGIFEK